MEKENLKIATGVALLAMAAGATAQIRPTYQYPTEGQGGLSLFDSPLFISPYVGFAVGRDDNIFTTKTNKKTSTLYITSPGFKLDARPPGMVFQGNYRRQVRRYAQSETDNHWDQTARATLDMDCERRTFRR